MLRDLLATDERRALEFFFVHLREVCEPSVARDELLYNASILAHYAQVSTASTEGVPMPPGLSSIFDQFVIDRTAHGDADMMETAAAQCLVLAGFFETQMRGRHAIGWYSELGAGFFGRAAAQQASARRAQLLRALARNFEPWRRRHARMSRELRDLPYLLPPRD
jgi:CO/xanthine dehydrogenase Mo-binding subunit